LKTSIKRLGIESSEGTKVLVTWVLLLIAYHVIYGAFFPTPQGTIGSDYGGSLAGLVDGFIWFEKNGPWAVPWFSPGFCGGVPFFADPQSGYYSVPQWLTFLVDPLSASYLTLLIFASVGYFGTYLLARRSFELDPWWAILAASLFFFNGFLAHRMIVGHLGYHGLTLAPWLALALLTHTPNRGTTIGLGILAGGIAAYWLHSGLTTLMIPAAMSVGLLLLVYRLQRPWPRDLWVRILISVSVSLILCVSKLVSSLSFYSQFERTQYPLPGFENPIALVVANLLALFAPSKTAAYVGANWLVNSQWLLMPHEWAYGFTIAPILIYTLARKLKKKEASRLNQIENRAKCLDCAGMECFIKISVVTAIIVIALMPLIYQFYTPTLNSWLKEQPLLGATAAPMRWLIIYLPAIPIISALLAQRVLVNHQAQAPRLIVRVLVVMILLNLAEFWQYFKDQPYHPETILAGYQLLAADSSHHRIHSIGYMPVPDSGVWSNLERNDRAVDGISELRCYSPAFGYRLEKFPQGKLMVGDVMLEHDGYLNIKNPACYVFPIENRCAPGDHFRVEDRKQAEAFVTYAPFDFIKSRTQQAADILTISGLLGLSTFLLFVWPWLAWRHRRRPGVRSAYPTT
jgi:hypothetical protein